MFNSLTEINSFFKFKSCCVQICPFSRNKAFQFQLNFVQGHCSLLACSRNCLLISVALSWQFIFLWRLLISLQHLKKAGSETPSLWCMKSYTDVNLCPNTALSLKRLVFMACMKPEVNGNYLMQRRFFLCDINSVIFITLPLLRYTTLVTLC